MLNRLEKKTNFSFDVTYYSILLNRFEQLKIPELKAKLAKTVAVVNKHELKCKGLNAKIDEVGAQFRAVEWVDPGEVEVSLQSFSVNSTIKSSISF